MGRLADVQNTLRRAEESAIVRADRDGRIGQVRVQRLKAALASLGVENAQVVARNARLLEPPDPPAPFAPDAAQALDRARAAYMTRVEDALPRWREELLRARAAALAARRATASERFELELTTEARRADAQRNAEEQWRLAALDARTRELVRASLSAQHAGAAEAAAAALDDASAEWAARSAHALTLQLEVGLRAMRVSAAVSAAAGGLPALTLRPRSADGMRTSTDRDATDAQTLCASVLLSAAEAIAAAAARSATARVAAAPPPTPPRDELAPPLPAPQAEPLRRGVLDTAAAADAAALPPRRAAIAVVTEDDAVASPQPQPQPRAPRANDARAVGAVAASGTPPHTPPVMALPVPAADERALSTSALDVDSEPETTANELSMMAAILGRLNGANLSDADAREAARVHKEGLKLTDSSEWATVLAAIAAANATSLPAELATRALRTAGTLRRRGRALLPANFLYDELLMKDVTASAPLERYASADTLQIVDGLVGHALRLAESNWVSAEAIASALSPLLLPVDHRNTSWAKRKVVQYLCARMAASARLSTPGSRRAALETSAAAGALSPSDLPGPGSARPEPIRIEPLNLKAVAGAVAPAAGSSRRLSGGGTPSPSGIFKPDLSREVSREALFLSALSPDTLPMPSEGLHSDRPSDRPPRSCESDAAAARGKPLSPSAVGAGAQGWSEPQRQLSALAAQPAPAEAALQSPALSSSWRSSAFRQRSSSAESARSELWPSRGADSTAGRSAAQVANDFGLSDRLASGSDAFADADAVDGDDDDDDDDEALELQSGGSDLWPSSQQDTSTSAEAARSLNDESRATPLPTSAALPSPARALAARPAREAEPVRSQRAEPADLPADPIRAAINLAQRRWVDTDDESDDDDGALFVPQRRPTATVAAAAPSTAVAVISQADLATSRAETADAGYDDDEFDF